MARGQGQGHKKNPRLWPRTEPLEPKAKAKDTKKIRGYGQGQNLSNQRPRTKDTDASVLQKKKKSSKNSFKRSQKIS